jgi:hypothetical protein
MRDLLRQHIMLSDRQEQLKPLGLGKRNKTFSAVVDGVASLSISCLNFWYNSLSCASDLTCTMAVRDIPTTDMINANADTKKTFGAVVDGVECLAGNAIDCAKTVDDVIDDF